MKLRAIITVLITSVAVMAGITSCSDPDLYFEGQGVEVFFTGDPAPNGGGELMLNVVAAMPWTISYQKESDRQWITLSPMEGSGSAVVTATLGANRERQRTATFNISTEYVTYQFDVVQAAAAGYEPGTILLREAFGTTAVTELTPVADFEGWSVQTADYLGTGAFIFNSNPSAGYEGASGGNNLYIPAGSFTFDIGGINILAYDRARLQFALNYTSDGNDPDTLPDIELLLGTEPDDMKSVELELIQGEGWMQVTFEFTKAYGGQQLHISLAGTNAFTILIDDITVETGGQGQKQIGTPVPLMTTITAAEVTLTSATMRGVYTVPDAGAGGASVTVTDAGFQYWLESDAEDESSWVTVSVPETAAGEEFSFQLDGLTPDTGYIYRVYTVSGGRTKFASTQKFTTLREEDEGDE